MKIYDDNWEGGKAPLDFDQLKPGIAHGLDFAKVGKRIHDRRMQLGLTAVEVAARARISRQTLAKFEAGQPFKHSTLRKLMFVLGLYTQDIKEVDDDKDFARLQSGDEIRWAAAYSASRYSKNANQTAQSNIQESSERERLGSTGLQPFFCSIFTNHLHNGTIRNPGLMELYQPSWFDQHPGEECVFVVRGTIRMIVRDREFVLVEGSCLVFNAFEPHKYIPEAPGADGGAPLIFVVLAQSPEDAQKGIRTWPAREKVLEESHNHITNKP